ncbi:MAG: dTDP-glucose 4,6-dehydratase [Chloroflexota bacterium]
MKNVLVTGGMGFIGSNFIRYALAEHTDWTITNLDKLTYAGNPENLRDIARDNRYRFVKGDIADAALIDEIIGQHFDVIVNFAAESHVDRSIMDASPFVTTNIRGVQVLLEGVRKHGAGRFIQISTDEVYGSLSAEGKFREDSPLMPNSPYAASKAAGDLLCRAYHHTYKLPVIVTHGSNNYGPYQFPEKLIPLVITNALEDKEIPVYGDGLNIRDWIHVCDHCRAIDLVIGSGRIGERYNIGAGSERTNLALVKKILRILHKSESLIRFVTDRPGHDQRYALDTTRIAEKLGFRPRYSFDEAIEDTVNWYRDHEDWWQHIKSGAYLSYYERMYTDR